jgi:hypothetical protein
LTGAFDSEVLSLLVIVIIVAAVFAVGCAEEENSGPLAPTADAILPGQVLMNTGNVTGNGIPCGTIDTITFTVGLVPGEKSVNLEQISFIYADAIRTEGLVPIEGFYGDPPQGSWEFWKCRTK